MDWNNYLAGKSPNKALRILLSQALTLNFIKHAALKSNLDGSVIVKSNTPLLYTTIYHLANAGKWRIPTKQVQNNDHTIYAVFMVSISYVFFYTLFILVLNTILTSFCIPFANLEKVRSTALCLSNNATISFQRLYILFCKE